MGQDGEILVAMKTVAETTTSLPQISSVAGTTTSLPQIECVLRCKIFRGNLDLFVFLLLSMCCLVTGTKTCLDLNDDEAESPFWIEAANRVCVECVEQEGCGYCLSTLRCVDGGNQGPTDGSPCPNWVHENGQCPEVPACSSHSECSACAAMEDCAWCASDKKCMTVGDVFSTDCRGTVFDLPCPDSYITENRVVGNMIVESDPAFGGGHLLASGPGSDPAQDFTLVVDSATFKVKSAGDVKLAAGDSLKRNSPGYGITIVAGDGRNKRGGTGGSVRFAGGKGNGQAATGGANGNGGDLLVQAGGVREGRGGAVLLEGGASTAGGSVGSSHVVSYIT
jgi:hypothetical protein